jgi:hypothetical protein
MFLIVLIILIILRTIKLKYQSILRNKVTFTKSILLRNLFIVNNLNEIKTSIKTENK